MEPTAEKHPETQTVFVRTRPMFALCNVTYLLSKPLANSLLPNPLANRFGKGKPSKRFVNAAGGVSRRDTLSRSRDRSTGVWVLSDGFEDDPSESH